jgi:hypothetical protein
VLFGFGMTFSKLPLAKVRSVKTTQTLLVQCIFGHVGSIVMRRGVEAE